MPKSTKHKKARVADFAKAKLKLGKGKQIASNATNTSISTKSIALPNQSLAVEKSVPTSRRNLTLLDLLVQARHYSTGVKKEALIELQQLLIQYPFLLNQHALPLVSSLSHLISDPSPTIRNLTLGLLTFVFQTLPASSLVGTSPGLILFTISSLSSLDEGTRISALKVLDLLLQVIPSEIVSGWEGDNDVLIRPNGNLEEIGVGGKVLEALFGVLRIRNPGLKAGQGGFTNAASYDLSPSSRVAVLTTLSTFLVSAYSQLTKENSSIQPWYLINSFATLKGYNSFLSSFYPSISDESQRSLEKTPHNEFSEVFELVSKSMKVDLSLTTLQLPSSIISSFPVNSTSSSIPPPTPCTLITLLNPTLLSSFLDSAPTAFAASLSNYTVTSNVIESHLNTISAVLSIAQEIYSRQLGGSNPSALERGAKEIEAIRKDLYAFLVHVGVYFPFGKDDLEARPNSADSILLQLNLSFASLVSLLVLVPFSTEKKFNQTISKSKQQKLDSVATKIESMVTTINDWIIVALKGETRSTTHPLGVKLTNDAYLALEPTMWSLLNQPSGKESERMFNAVVHHFGDASSSSEVKKTAFIFLARIILIPQNASYVNSFKITNFSMITSVSKWLLSLPKYLWELGQKCLKTTELILLFLKKAVQQLCGRVLPSSIILPLQISLLPFFHLQHPTRGTIFGPFGSLPERLQNLGIDFVSILIIETLNTTRDVSKAEQVRAIEQSLKLRESVGVVVTVKGGQVLERWIRVQDSFVGLS